MDHLTSTLRQLLEPGTDPTPAFDRILADYARYHVVFAVLGSVVAVGSLVLARWCWRRFRRAPKVAGARWTFERKAHLFVASASLGLAAILGVVVLANVSNAANPRPGLAGSVDMIPDPRPGSEGERVQQAFTDWLTSGATATPEPIQDRIDRRLAWQFPKAMITGALLVAAVFLAALCWRILIRRSRVRHGSWPGRDRALLAVAIGLGPVCLLLLAMFLGNTQASLAPLSMTLLFG